MNPTHTPGPWQITEVHCNPDCLEWLITCSRPATGSCRENPLIAICEEMGGSSEGEDEGRANARLIAAAPDLLIACQKLVTWLRSIRGEDERLVIDHGFEDGFNLTEAEGIIQQATQP